MNKKTIMSIIAVLVIFVIIIIISLILLNLENGENEKPSNEKEIIQTEQISQVKDNNLFFTIENCLAKYKYILNLNYEEQFDDLNMPTLAYEYGIQTEEQKKQAVINTLDKQYLEENNININNIYDFLDESTEEIEVEAIKINNILDNNSKIKIYTIYAKIKYLEQNKETFEFNIIKVDESQEAFSVYPLKDGEYENLDDIKINNNIEKIDKNNNNVYINMEYSDGQIATKYFQEYKQLMLTNIQEAYEKLNNEYKQKRFGNINKFESFVKDNLEKIEYMQIYQFSVQEQEGYKKYICKDFNEDYYIINEIAPREYNIILDTYTIDLPEFTNAYNSANEIKKVGYNIERIKEAMNWKDYEYVYNKLDETYRNTNFGNIENFKQFINTKFYNRSNIEFISASNEGNVYIYNVSIIDAENESNSNQINILMKLGEGTDYILSFGV